MKRHRIAVIGSRGIPARYGGYETLIEEIAVRLVRRGLGVTVYCRSHSTPRDLRSFKGVDLVVLPTIATKHLDTPVHTLLSCLHAAVRPYDAALVVNSANVFFLPILEAGEIPVALHVDGIERKRAKWGRLGRSTYALSERLATRAPAVLITDAEVIRRHYLESYGCDSTVITYGVSPRLEPPGDLLRRLGVEPRGYFLYVSRFEPENNPHRVVAAYRDVRVDLPLVMVGDAPYAGDFIHSFQSTADRRVIFPGSIYGAGYRELLSNALAYIQATEVGGTHPALVEAMGYGNCVVVNDTPENREVAGDAGLYFTAHDPATLSEQLDRIGTGEVDLKALRDAAARRAAERFDWERVVDRYEAVLRSLATARGGSETGQGGNG